MPTLPNSGPVVLERRRGGSIGVGSVLEAPAGMNDDREHPEQRKQARRGEPDRAGR